MQDMEIKKKVLDEIMELMDEKEGEKLKMHPKLMAAKIEVVKPKDSESEMIKEKRMGDISEMEPNHEASETQDEESAEEEISPEMIELLLKKYKDQI